MKKIFALFFTILFALSLLPFTGAADAHAATSDTQFDRTDVLEDLKSTEEFSLSKYPYYESVNPEIHVINVVEYCYSFYANLRDHYGLYIYVYNPGALDLDTSNAGNKVQLAVKYSEDPITENSEILEYEKFSLKCCSVSSAPDTERLFYKFKVIDHESADGKTIAERVNSAARRYDISGIELVTKGESTAHEYPITGNFALMKSDDGYGSFTFTGFAKGYGANTSAESTLACTVHKLETVKLDVRHTFYRTQTASTAFDQNQIDSVYFSVPKRLFDNYGTLQRIKAEWYEYRTREMLVTNNQTYYDFIKQYIGVDWWHDGSPVPKKYYFITPPSDIGFGGVPGHSVLDFVETGWNMPGDIMPLHRVNPLYYIFKTSGDIEAYDPYAEDVVGQGGVSSNELYEYIKSYDKTANNGYLPIKNGQISADLFEKNIPESRRMDNERGKVQQGYSYYDFDADLDLQSWLSWTDANPNFWQNWNKFGFWDALFGDIPEETGRTIAPIQVITPDSKELNLSSEDLSNELCINRSDVSEFKRTCNDAFTVNGAADEEMYVVLFHFATSQYHSHEVYFGEKDAFLYWDDYETGQGYLADQEVYFDFDIIQLSFLKDETWTVIAAVSDPIDIVNPVTTPTVMSDEEGLPWWAWILIAVVALLVIIFFGVPILKFLLQLVIFLITAPFKLIAGIVRGLKKPKKKDRDDG